MLVRFASRFEGRRLRVRRVDEDSFAGRVAERAIEEDTWVADVTHGGDVANAYRYPAETECVLAISDPFGNVVVWTGRAPANKVTLRGAAEACLGGSGDLFDLRIKSEDRRTEALKILKDLHNKHVPAMLVIASAGA